MVNVASMLTVCVPGASVSASGELQAVYRPPSTEQVHVTPGASVLKVNDGSEPRAGRWAALNASAETLNAKATIGKIVTGALAIVKESINKAAGFALLI